MKKNQTNNTKQNRRFRGIAALTLALVLCAGVVTDVAAARSNSIGYAVRALFPDNQLDASALYFDLLIEPEQQQTLKVAIMNRGAEEIEVAVEANTAFSNDNGVIEFTQSDARDPSLAVDFAEIVTPVEPVITVPAQGEAIAEFILTTPEEPFDGMVFGGLMFTKRYQGTESEDGGSMAIGNVYRYVIGVRLRENEDVPGPEFELLDAEIGRTHNPALLLHLRNTQPAIARGIALKAWVYPEDSEDALLTFERGNVAMAPNSSMRYTLYFEGGKMPLEPGSYRVAVEMAFGERTWQFETPLRVD